MKTINQVVSSVTPGDAVSDQVLAWRRVFQRWGFQSEIVAGQVHQDLRGLVHRLADDGEALIAKGSVVLHYTIWSGAVEAALQAAGPRALWYHNVTPGDLLRPFNPGTAALCDQARRALTNFKGRFDALIAVSSFNAADLVEAGLGPVEVVPLLLDVTRVTPRARRNGSPVILSVGRIAPNKRLEDVVKVFALYQKYREPTASLVLVGPEDGFESYRTAVGRLVERVGARRVQFTGRITAAERDQWYAQASAYLCMSVHEGFCAPLIEALTHGVPVVARKAGAVPETLAGAGLVIDGEDLPLFAEALHEVVSSPTTRTVLAGAAKRRLAELRPEAVEARAGRRWVPCWSREVLRPVSRVRTACHGRRNMRATVTTIVQRVRRRFEPTYRRPAPQDVSDERSELARVGTTWERLAQIDPLWAVLSEPDKKGRRWVAEEFLATGEAEVAALLADLERLGFSAHGEAVDFGCGAGRLSIALARHFEHVTSIDISPTMLAIAKQFAGSSPSITFVHNARPDLACLADSSVDLVYSNIVLQHMDAHLAVGYLQEFARALRPDGVLAFQLPSHLRDDFLPNGNNLTRSARSDGRTS